MEGKEGQQGDEGLTYTGEVECRRIYIPAIRRVPPTPPGAGRVKPALLHALPYAVPVRPALPRPCLPMA